MQPRKKVIQIVFFQRGVITLEKGPADLFQPQASTRITGSEASPCERRFIERKTEEKPLNPTASEHHHAPP